MRTGDRRQRQWRSIANRLGKIGAEAVDRDEGVRLHGNGRRRGQIFHLATRSPCTKTRGRRSRKQSGKLSLAR